MKTEPVNLTDGLLRSVTKPARYVGGEWNSVTKPLSSDLVRFAFCFPDVYEIGMSNSALQILYYLLNQRPDTWCERSFAPWTDMEQLMREKNIPLYSLESRTPLSQFDWVGFTLQYELSFTNVLNMLDLAGIPLLTSERSAEDPLVVAGGPVAFNLEPMADFFDLAVIGEAEETIEELIDLYHQHCPNGRTSTWDRSAFLRQAAAIPGVYVPSLYAVVYKTDQTVEAIRPLDGTVPPVIQKRIVKNLNTMKRPDQLIVPNTEIVHDRMSLELFRGCPRGCRFCQAGMIYRPVRETGVDTLSKQAAALEQSTGYDECGLLSLSTSDYSQLGSLTDRLLEQFSGHHTSLSLPSLRLDSFTLELMQKGSSTRKSGLTFAPEAGTQRLRDVINKNITEQDLLEAMTLAFKGGWNGAKLYFMLGLPTETDMDAQAIADLTDSIETLYRGLPRSDRPRRLELTVSTAVFIPKPHTPFQWAPQELPEVVNKRQQFLKERFRNRPVKYHYHDWHSSLIEALLARGDRRLGAVIRDVWAKGQTFDAWDDHFKLDNWLDSLEKFGLDVSFYAHRERAEAEIMPWDHIDCGVTSEFLYREYQKALKAKTTPQCRIACSQCGATTFEGGICFGD